MMVIFNFLSDTLYTFLFYSQFLEIYFYYLIGPYFLPLHIPCYFLLGYMHLKKQLPLQTVFVQETTISPAKATLLLLLSRFSRFRPRATP